MKVKRTLFLLFYLLAGIVTGAMLASLCSGVSWLSWLSYSSAIGLNRGAPLILDLSVLQITFGFSMSISVAQVITIGFAIFLFNKSKIR